MTRPSINKTFRSGPFDRLRAGPFGRLRAGSFWRSALVVLLAATLATLAVRAWTGPSQPPAGGNPASGTIPAGTVFPASPTDGQEYVYIADGANGVYWHFKYRTATSKWIFVGGAPLVSEIVTRENKGAGGYADLATVGPSVALPFAADYDVQISYMGRNGGASAGDPYMSYDIGGTAAVDADSTNPGAEAVLTGSAHTGFRMTRKTGLTAVTLTAKYKAGGSNNFWFAARNMQVWPVQK